MTSVESNQSGSVAVVVEQSEQQVISGRGV
ncbi:hypothetical protein SAMN04489716_1783 [Actinoplanes derwentensis]|uniref:Uncharacterized protein n=1 Tax=Actinoplanes derwentensis TaxID=113562 RepID=A0A1H1VL23_9ACTN|nr:hypothetical protein SAMN04489716_1783 [Actinoplanes derwentensis]